MSKDNREDIQNEGIDYSYIGLMSSKIRIGIIGGGKAGFIKARHFALNGCYVEIIAKEFSKELIDFSKEYNLILVKAEFTIKFLQDKHIIIMAVDDKNLKYQIRQYCDSKYKIYIDSSNFKDGMGIVPVERQSKHIMFALNTKLGNPKGAVLISKKIKNIIDEYDDFIEFTSKVRNNSKGLSDYKKEILEVIGTEEFAKLYKENMHEEFLRRRFPDEIVDYIMK